MSNPIVLIELNEVPNEVLDAYARTSSFMADFLASSERYETLTPDAIQLDPWIAWPTFHRGVNDEVHGILRLGQDTTQADQKFPPIWQILSRHGLPVGVYGSLFSSSEQDLSPYSFFVPDVFSPHANITPSDLADFQMLNLSMTRASARNADGGVSAGGGKVVAGLALRGRLELATLGRVAAQLIDERRDRRRLSRRRNIQTELHADIFCSLFKQKRPKFASFYTNNVAAAMHRFWSASMPGAKVNQGRLAQDWVAAYSDEVFAALRSVERLLKRFDRGEFGPVTLVVASAIGQEEIPAENHSRFLTITNIDAFVAELLPERADSTCLSTSPTMVPDFTIHFEDAELASYVCAQLERLKIGDHQPLETMERMKSKELVVADGGIVHIRHNYGDDTHFKHLVTFSRSDSKTVHISFQIDDYEGPLEAQVGNYLLPFERMGIGFVSHEEGVNCTAQHSAKGSLLVSARGSGSSRRKPLPLVPTIDFVPSVLSYFGVPVPAHLKGAPSIDLH